MLEEIYIKMRFALHSSLETNTCTSGASVSASGDIQYVIILLPLRPCLSTLSYLTYYIKEKIDL